ncbi:hypothetical protein [Maritalea myrionectae]|uniref:hypothetical protein n=1 Tax=Maritalea myrionectae TaxID=454601 RepID=UPI0013C2BF75|nr:hypothetical protein [Maritalea myrionectae]
MRLNSIRMLFLKYDKESILRYAQRLSIPKADIGAIDLKFSKADLRRRRFPQLDQRQMVYLRQNAMEASARHKCADTDEVVKDLDKPPTLTNERKLDELLEVAASKIKSRFKK